MGPEAKANLVPNYLKASSPDLLRDLMLEHNLSLGGFVTYQDIQFANGSWYAWFYIEHEHLNLNSKSKKD